MFKFAVTLLASSAILMGALGAPLSTDSLERRSESLETREPRIAAEGGRIISNPAFRPLFTRLRGPAAVRPHAPIRRLPIRAPRRSKREEGEELEGREPRKIAVGGGRPTRNPNFRPLRKPPILSGPGSVRSHGGSSIRVNVRPNFSPFTRPGKVKREQDKDLSAREFEDQEARDLGVDELEEVMERDFDDLD